MIFINPVNTVLNTASLLHAYCYASASHPH